MINTIAATHRFARPYTELAPAYDIALGVPNFIGTRATFETLVKRYGINFRSAADIGCGTGLFACYLNRCWDVPVFAIDRSPEMLRIAMRNCAGSNVRFLQQDIRCLRLPWPVDLITANFDTMNHILTEAELQLAFRRIRDNLAHGGHFIFDLITSCQPLGSGRTYSRHLGSENCRAVQRIHWNPSNSMLSISVTIHRRAAGVSALELHRERAYCPAQVSQWLMDLGFVIRGVHDAVTLRTAALCQPRLIVVARKSPE